MAEQQLKILHLITHLGIGGAQDNTLLTVEKHDRQRYCVHLAANPTGQWKQRAQTVADTFHPLPNLVVPIHPLQDLITLFSLVKLLRREKFDLVHTHSSKAGILGRWAAKIAGVPHIVHTIHGFAFHDFMANWKRQLYINLEQISRGCTNFFITVSELNRQEALGLGLLDLEHSQTVYSGIEFKNLNKQFDDDRTRRHLGIPPNWQVVVMVGRLDAQKAPHYLIEAFAIAVQTHPQTLLLLVGDGELKPQLEQQVARLGLTSQVRFLGFREDVPDIVNMANIFALSSLWEGLGRAMTEAMLLGKPVVVPAIYGIPEIVHHQETGLLFPAGNIQQLAEQLIYLLQSSTEQVRLGQNAQRLTRELFDADHMVQQIEAIYQRLLQSPQLATHVN